MAKYWNYKTKAFNRICVEKVLVIIFFKNGTLSRSKFGEGNATLRLGYRLVLNLFPCTPALDKHIEIFEFS